MHAAPTPDFSFFWHDYETFGRIPRRDGPAQFAGVRTDAELNEIAAPVTLYCHPPRDRLPEPEACLLTGIVPQLARERGLPEHAFAAAVERELAQPGTVGVGYNSIRFDDEVTRHLFWRNLIDPYAREWQNDCGRWDLLDTVRCCWALRPDGLEWPLREDGHVSLKLEDLSAANGLAHEAAHDALSDVRATLALARRVRTSQPRLWDFCLKLRRKEAVWDEIGPALDRPFLHISGMYGAERGGLALVWPLSPHPSNRNELIVWDLAHDPRQLDGLDAASIRERLYTRAEDLPEGVTRLPIKTIHVNKSPVVIGNLGVLQPAQAERWGLDVARALGHATEAARRGRAAPELWAEVYRRPPPEQPVDVDEDLYGGFVGKADRRTLERLRALSPEALRQRRPAFEDERLDELLFRYRARNFPETLDDAERDRWRRHCAARLPLADYFERLDALHEQAGEQGAQVLEALYDWAVELSP